MCAAYLGLPGSEVEVEWSTSASAADISDQVDSPFDLIDLKTLTLTGVDSDYCGVYTCTETVTSNFSVSESIILDVGELVLLFYIASIISCRWCLHKSSITLFSWS